MSFEIGMLGRHGLDINYPKSSNALRALPGAGVLGAGALLYHVCGVQEDRAGVGCRVDLGEEWGMAERLGGEEGWT